MPRGTLEVILISAKDLHDSDFFGKMDPYVILTYRAQEHKSSVAKGAGSTPHWNESFLFTVSDSVSELNLRLMDQDRFRDDFLGEIKIDLEPVFEAGSIPETSYNVVKNEKYCGEVKVAITFNPEVHRKIKKEHGNWYAENNALSYKSRMSQLNGAIESAMTKNKAILVDENNNLYRDLSG